MNSSLKTTVRIEELEDGLELTVKTEGLDRLPARLEILMPAGTELDHEAFYQRAAAGESMILRKGVLRLREDRTELEIGPGFGEHEFQGHYSGEETNPSGYTVYCNAYTPFEKKFRLRVIRREEERHVSSWN